MGRDIVSHCSEARNNGASVALIFPSVSGGPRSAIHSVAMSPDGKTLVTGSWDGAALWDAATGAELHFFQRRRAGGAVGSIALSPDGQTLAAGTTNDEIHLWDVTTWRHLELKGHKGRVDP